MQVSLTYPTLGKVNQVEVGGKVEYLYSKGERSSIASSRNLDFERLFVYLHVEITLFLVEWEEGYSEPSTAREEEETSLYCYGSLKLFQNELWRLRRDEFCLACK